MFTASFRRKTVLLVLVGILALPWMSVAKPGPEGTQPQTLEIGPLTLLECAWSFLRNAWSKTGCHIDPNGHCTTQPPVQTKEGCHIDPNGRCTAQPVQPDTGCHIDPDGRCVP